MQKRTRMLSALGAGAALALVLGACGSGSGGGDAGSGDAAGGSWTLGTTETITAMDPAGSYDMGSWNMQYQIFQRLLAIPANGSEPEPDAAESCTQDDAQTITCKLKSGLKFSNGHDLTASDVKYSFERNLKIADPNGSSVLLGSISNGDDNNPALADGAIETPDDSTIVFHLNKPDLTFMMILSTATTSIVDEETFPADALVADDAVVGSGPYKLSQYKAGEQAVLEANADYAGAKPASGKVFVRYFTDPVPLKQAIESGQIDVAWRTLSPTDLNSLRDGGKVDVLEGKGSEFRYWVWQLSTDAGKQQAVRQAVAQLIDRDTIAKDAYDGVVNPSYSIVPPGFAGQRDSFKEKYGDPNVDAAKKILTDAGVTFPVKLTLGYTPTHYGPNAVDEANELKEQLDASGLFTTKVDSAEWEQYQSLYKEGAYDLFILGWYPDFLDADNYLSPFLRDGGFYANNYKNAEVNKLLDEQLAQTDVAKRNEIIGQLQDIVARDVPLVPSWNGKNVAVASKEMKGVLDTLDPTYIFRFWMISKN